MIEKLKAVPKLLLDKSKRESDEKVCAQETKIEDALVRRGDPTYLNRSS